MTNRVPTLPQPPIVYGPSEINEWISGSFGSRGPGPSAKRARAIEGMAVQVWSDSVPPVRARSVVVLEALGYGLEGLAAKPPLRFRKGHRTIVVRFHPSILKEAVTVAVRFAPPVTAHTATKIADGFADEFPLRKVSMTDAPRDARPPRDQRLRSTAKRRSDRP